MNLRNRLLAANLCLLVCVFVFALGLVAAPAQATDRGAVRALERIATALERGCR